MTTDAHHPLAAPARPNRVLPVLGVIVLILAAGLLLFLTRSGTPQDASPEAGFARDMAVHHAQAVQMSFIVRDKSTDETIRTLAYDIITTQSTQRGIFMGWLQQWGLNQGSVRPPMAWMSGHAHGAGGPVPTVGAAGGAAAMPGMATAEELNRLQAASGKDAEILFLQLMIRHHEGGVEMAQGLLDLSDRTEVRELAQHIVDSQQAEIKTMKELLAERGAQPLPSILSPRSS